MADIDIQAQVEKDITDFASQQGLNLYDFDLSGLTVTVEPTIYEPPKVDSLQPKDVKTREFENCTRQPRAVNDSMEAEDFDNWKVDLNTRIKFGKSMSSSIKAIATVVIGSGFNVEIDLGAGGSFGGSRKIVFKTSESTQVAPCTLLKVSIVESGANYAIPFHIPLFVMGNVKCKARVSWPYGNPDVDWSYAHLFQVPGVATLSGHDFKEVWAEYRASCPPGTPCSVLSGTTDADFWKKESFKPKKNTGSKE
jgi:hypothetical protein